MQKALKVDAAQMEQRVQQEPSAAAEPCLEVAAGHQGQVVVPAAQWQPEEGERSALEPRVEAGARGMWMLWGQAVEAVQRAIG